jgi:uncharacterized protein YggE
MEEKTVEEIIKATHRVRAFAAFALCMLGIFLLVATVGELKGLAYIGSGIAPTDTISADGEGDVFAVPDTATFSFTVDETAKDVATAQASATTKSNAIIEYLKGQGIADTDIQTTDYSINPQYSYSQAGCPQPAVSNGSGTGISIAPAIYCPPGKQTITGYEVSQTVSVQVHDTSKAGAFLAGIGSKGASNVSGLSLTVSNEDALQIQARNKAIVDAQGKAQALAKSLGVQLVRIVGYSDNSGRIVPYAQNMAMGATAAAAPAPEIPTGQNKITSDVTITYEIR